MKNILSILLAVIFIIAAEAQNAHYVKVVPGETIAVKGNLGQGIKVIDRSWAWNSSVACFPAIRQNKFSGNHVLYWADLPRFSEMEIVLIPDDPKSNLSLYAYVVGKVTQKNMVPNLTSCIRCEADFKWEFNRRGQNQDHTRSVRNLVALNHPYQVVIGVAGAEGLDRGAYKLSIRMKSR